MPSNVDRMSEKEHRQPASVDYFNYDMLTI